jgi:hypothetical protein
VGVSALPSIGTFLRLSTVSRSRKTDLGRLEGTASRRLWPRVSHHLPRCAVSSVEYNVMPGRRTGALVLRNGNTAKLYGCVSFSNEISPTMLAF